MTRARPPPARGSGATACSSGRRTAPAGPDTVAPGAYRFDEDGGRGGRGGVSRSRRGPRVRPPPTLPAPTSLPQAGRPPLRDPASDGTPPRAAADLRPARRVRGRDAPRRVRGRLPPGGPAPASEPAAALSAAAGGAPRAGYSVVWWDPNALELDIEARFGIRQAELLSKDAPQDVVDGDLDRYRAWRRRRGDVVAKAEVPSVAVVTVDGARAPPGRRPRAGADGRARAAGARRPRPPPGRSALRRSRARGARGGPPSTRTGRRSDRWPGCRAACWGRPTARSWRRRERRRRGSPTPSSTASGGRRRPAPAAARRR